MLDCVINSSRMGIILQLIDAESRWQTCCCNCERSSPWLPGAQRLLGLLIHRIVQCMGGASPQHCWTQAPVQACDAMGMNKLSSQLQGPFCCPYSCGCLQVARKVVGLR